MIVLGLTGSIGMGKTLAAAMLESLKIPVHEADDEVHELLAPNGKAAIAVGAAFPYFQYSQIYGEKTKSGNRKIKRGALGQVVFHDEKKRLELEKILHPLVREAQGTFIRKHKTMGTKIVALDIPLLFETGGEKLVNYTFVVSAPYEIQKQRVLARPGMDEEKFQAILERQMPDGEKRARADFVIHTGLGRAQTMREIKAALATIKKKEKKPDGEKESARPLSRKARKAEMFETILSEKGWSVEHVYAPKEDIAALDVLEPDLVLIMGGPMGVYEQEKFPWLTHEITFIKKRLAQDLPMLGICLGSQLIAAALGQKIYKGDKGKEIGWTEIQVNEAGKNHAIRHVDGSQTPTFHWHGDTYQVPDNARLLASTPAYKAQAYAVGKTLAFQFHPEVTAPQLEQWFEEEIDELEESILCTDIETIRQQNKENAKILNKQVRLMMDEWLPSVGLL